MADQEVKVLEIQVPGAQGPAWVVGSVTDWSPIVSYAVGNAVLFGGKTYRAVQANLNQEPPGDAWELIASGGESSTVTLAQRLGAAFLGA